MSEAYRRHVMRHMESQRCKPDENVAGHIRNSTTSDADAALTLV
jgi:hypothetical protein